MIVSISDFSYVLCPGNRSAAEFLSQYGKIYDCWYSLWDEAFQEMGVIKKMTSDAFTRQDLIGAVFYKDLCIGMCFYRWLDAKRKDFAEESYFKIWNRDHIKALCSRGNKILVCSNLTLHPSARGFKLGFSGKDLMIGMTIQTYIHSNTDAMTGAMRVDRGANTATLRWGATTIAHRVPCDYGQDNTELVGFFRDELIKSPRHELQSFSESLWNRRTLIPREVFEYEFKENQTPFADLNLVA